MVVYNLFLLLLSFVVMWRASGMVINLVEKIANSVKVTKFAASFLILGILTSLSEITVGINAVVDKRPGIFVGNLIGGVFVILVLVIPLLTILNGGIRLANHLDKKRMLFFLALLLLPALMVLDNQVSTADAWIILIFYALFFYTFQRGEKVGRTFTLEKMGIKKFIKYLSKIILGIALIYGASIILVNKTVFFAEFLSIPTFLISLLVLAIGTNLPEIVIALKSIKMSKSEIAFGDYIGSAATNSLLFGIFTLIHGPFEMDNADFNLSFIIMLVGFYLFYHFARSKNRISVIEGALLILVYVVFVLFQATEILKLSPVL